MEEYVRMSNQHISNLRNKAEEELDVLEKEFLGERKKKLIENKAKIDKLFREQELKEEEYVKKREENEENYHTKNKKVKQIKYKEYFDLKLALENEIESHEKCLEDMRAIYTLNSVKLNYNFKVLSEKKDENSVLAETLKKKERYFLNLLKKKHDECTFKG
jgi:dynein regulatory complex protein 1